MLTRLAEDPMQLSRELDWVAKLELLEGYRTRDGLDWEHPRLQLVDLQYSDVRPDKGLYNRLAARGRIDPAGGRGDGRAGHRSTPPEDTRAYFRGRCLQQYPESVAAASWDSVIFDIPGRESLQRVPDPGAAARHPGARRRAAGPLPHRRRAGRRPHRAALSRASAPHRPNIADHTDAPGRVGLGVPAGRG